MPVMDGFQMLEELNKRKLIEKIPVLVISGENSTQNEQKCFELGIADFIGKPFNANLVRKRVQNAAEHYAYRNELEDKVEEQTNVLRKAYKPGRTVEAPQSGYYRDLRYSGRIPESGKR